MTRVYKNRIANRGASPGSFIFIGDQKIEKPLIRLMEYNPENLREEDIADIIDIDFSDKQDKISWVNVDGLHDPDVFLKIQQQFDVPPLILEDIMNTSQRPKVEEFDDLIFIVIKMLIYDAKAQSISTETMSFIMGDHFLLTFQERVGDFFDPVRERIRNGKGRIRRMGTDYLTYALIDTIIDNYHYIIANLAERIENLEEDLLDNPGQAVLAEINNLKRELSFFKKAVKPVQLAILDFNRLETDLIRDETVPYLRDLQDITIQASEAVDNYRELIADQLNVYNTSISNRLNDIMKVLTIFSALFIPLTFLAGIYGTNFSYLPELNYKYSYFIFWGVLIMVGAAMIYYFRRKGWIGKN